MNNALIQIELPAETIAVLERTARRQQRSVDEVVRDLILQDLPELPSLPENVEAELAAFGHSSDDALWLLTESTFSPAQQNELAYLNDAAQARHLTEEEQQRQQELVDTYDRSVLRRAQAASILKERGYDLSRLISSQPS